MYQIILDTLTLTILLLFHKYYFALQNPCSIILNVEPSELYLIRHYYSMYSPWRRSFQYHLEAFQVCRILDPKVDLWN